jgi:bifunctional non-homologous end joining protein LigD
VEDHPLDYLTFTGAIPEGNYGAGEVFRWDIGTFALDDPSADPVAAWKRGSIQFELHGTRLKGKWHLFRMKGRQQGEKPLWLLRKAKDRFADHQPSAPAIGNKKSDAPSRGAPVRIKPAKIKRFPRPTERPITLEAFLALKKPEGAVTVEIAGEPVAFTHLDRIYWPEEEISKFDLLSYYIRIAPRMLPFLEERPAILQRYPGGIGAPKFFQHDLESAPGYLYAVRMQNEEGREIDYAVYRGLPSLLYLVNIGTIEQHPWHSRLAEITRPDWLVLDLDPHAAPWENVIKTALTARKVFERHGLRAYPKTSGSSGIHIYLPLRPEYEYEAVSEFAHALAKEVADAIPEIATVERTLAERKKAQVYVDWLQNAKGKSMAAPYSVRARPGAPVSMPLTWEQVAKGVRISDFPLKNIFRRMARRKDSWSRFFDDRQKIG